MIYRTQKVDRTPCRRCQCAAALHAGTRCYCAKHDGLCDCPGLLVGVDRETRAYEWAVVLLIVGALSVVFGSVPW